MKEAFYFSHDYNARNDRKMVALAMRHGMEGIGIYWCIIEMLYEEKGYLMQSECERIAFELRTQCDIVKSVLHDFDLFKNDHDQFYSESVLSRLKVRISKSEKARESASKRWGNKTDANAMRTQCDGNAIKERKGKNNIRSNAFEMFWKAYPKKKSIGQAEKAFSKINPDEHLLASMIASIEKAKTQEDWVKEKGKYIPYPATWLNAKGWIDEEVEDLESKQQPTKPKTYTVIDPATIAERQRKRDLKEAGLI